MNGLGAAQNPNAGGCQVARGSDAGRAGFGVTSSPLAEVRSGQDVCVGDMSPTQSPGASRKEKAAKKKEIGAGHLVDTTRDNVPPRH